MSTESDWYAERLRERQGKRWKKLLRVQAPYQWHLRRQRLGRCLDVGCGVGRNLGSLEPGSLGVDHNAAAVAEARSRGLNAITVEEFRAAPPDEGSFDGLLFAHILEHMSRRDAARLLDDYLPYLRPGGRIFVVCPQERGYHSDATHVWFATDDELIDLCDEAGLDVMSSRSFPFPRWAGPVFIYNEFTVTARLRP